MTYIDHHQPSYVRSDETLAKQAAIQRGTKRSPESNLKRSLAAKAQHAANPELAVRFAERRRSTPMSDETKAKISRTRSAKLASGEIVINREKVSETITRNYLEGGFAWATGRHTSPKTGLVSTFRSSWEKVLMQQLDADPSVVSWKSEGFCIPYELDGKMRRYVPDLLVDYADGHREFVEVKPHELRNHPKNVAKREAAKKWCNENGVVYTEWAPPVVP